MPLNNKEQVKLVFTTLANECGVSDKEFTYSFVYDSTSYKNDSKEIKVDKDIIIGENNNSLPLKEEIGKGVFFYRVDDFKDITTLKIVPYTFNKINTNSTAVGNDGRARYIIEDKIITVNLK